MYGCYKEIVSKLRNKNTIVWKLQGNRLKVAEYEHHSMVVTRKSSQSCWIWILMYGSYKEIAWKFRDINTIACSLQWNLLIYSCEISIPLYGSCKESISNLRNINTLVWSLQGNRVKFAEYEYLWMVVTRKESQSCGIWIPSMVFTRRSPQTCRMSISLFGSYEEIVSKLGNMNAIVW